MTSTRQAFSRSRWFVPAASATAVAAVVAAMVGVVSTAGGNDRVTPPVLHLASFAGGSGGLPASPAAGIADQGGSPSTGGAPGKDGDAGFGVRGSGWRLEGTLPSGPASGRVYLLPAGATTRAFVSRLADALGMSGEPMHLKDGWYLVSGTTELSVSELDGRHWTFANHGCIAGPVLNPQAGSGCAVAESSPPILAPLPSRPSRGGAPRGGVSVPNRISPPPAAGSHSPVAQPQSAPVLQPQPLTVAEPIPVPENVARRLARPVLEAVGVNPDAIEVDTGSGQRSVVFSPEVGGSRVLGLDTRVSVDEKGKVVDASGWLATPTAAAEYPLISARQGYDQLLQQPQPMMALGMPCRIVEGTQGCAPIPDRVVTGATPGLTQAYSTDRGMLLVPAWLFHVRGQSTPVAVVAVQRSFLGQPEEPNPGRPAIGGGPGRVGGGIATNGGVGSAPGSADRGTAVSGTTEVTVAPTQLE